MRACGHFRRKTVFREKILFESRGDFVTDFLREKIAENDGHHGEKARGMIVASMGMAEFCNKTFAVPAMGDEPFHEGVRFVKPMLFLFLRALLGGDSGERAHLENQEGGEVRRFKKITDIEQRGVVPSAVRYRLFS